MDETTITRAIHKQRQRMETRGLGFLLPMSMENWEDSPAEVFKRLRDTEREWEGFESKWGLSRELYQRG